jgi:ribose 5-phosphate isomerase A
MDIAQLKRQAAEHAVQFVESGMIVGLGHGSTAIWATRRIAELLRSGVLRDIQGVPCSVQVEEEARGLRIPLIALQDVEHVDITIDGADEIDPQLNLIKGGGGAMLREKIVAEASRREIIIADSSKLSPALGTHWAVPVEVIPFGYASAKRYLESLGAEAILRLDKSKQPFQTDQKNYVIDCRFGIIDDPGRLNVVIKSRAGIVEHGLFVGIASDVIVADSTGIRHLTRP